MKSILFLYFFLGVIANAQRISDSQIVENSMPQEVLTIIDPDSNQPRKLEKKQIIQKFYTDSFGSKDGSRYIIATYSNSGISEENSVTRTILIKVGNDGKATILRPPTVNKNYNINENSEVQLIDLDDDNINEMVVVNYSLKGYEWDSKIFKWSGSSLTDVSPPGKNGKPGLLLQLDLEAFPLIIYSKIIESKNGAPNNYVQKIAQLSSGSIKDLGTFDFIKVVSKDSKKVEEKTYQINNVQEGSYTLEVKNLSKHPRSVRAEISVNDVVVLKPTDFCHGKPKPFVKQKEKNGHDVLEDDDDDQDEDHCKRCDPRKDIYANVNLKPEGNTLKVKLYGNKGSKIQITLKKK